MSVAFSLQTILKHKYTFWISLLSIISICTSEILLDIIIGDGDGFISNPFLANPIFFLKNISFAILAASIFIKQQSNIFFIRSSPILFSIFRISYGLLLLCIGFQAIDYTSLSLVYDEQTLNNYRYLWICSILLTTLGTFGKIPQVLALIGIPFYLDGTVGTHLLRIAGFWMLFMGSEQKLALKVLPKRIRPILTFPNWIWPNYMLGLHLGLIIFSAGISKFNDPLWRQGYGFYYTFLQPWLKSDFFNFLMNYEWLMILLNYLTVISEIVALAIILKATRIIGFIAILSMYLLLTFVFRIDPIGPAGLCICIGLLPIVLKKTNYVVKSIPPPRHYITISLGIFLAFMVSFESLLYIAHASHYPIVDPPFSLNGENRKKLGIDQVDNKYFRYAYKSLINQSFWNSLKRVVPGTGRYAPFNLHDIFGRLFYTIELDEKPAEDQVFDQNGNTNFFGPSGGVFRPRILQNRMHFFGILYHKIAVNQGIDSLSKYELDFTRDFLNFMVEKYQQRGITFETLTLKTKIIELPNHYLGNVQPWINKPFIDLVSINSRTKTLRFNSRIPKYKFDPGKVEYLKGLNITLRP